VSRGLSAIAEFLVGAKDDGGDGDNGAIGFLKE